LLVCPSLQLPFFRFPSFPTLRIVLFPHFYACSSVCLWSPYNKNCSVFRPREFLVSRRPNLWMILRTAQVALNPRPITNVTRSQQICDYTSHGPVMRYVNTTFTRYYTVNVYWFPQKKNPSNDLLLYLTRHGSYDVTTSLNIQAMNTSPSCDMSTQYSRVTPRYTSNDFHKRPFKWSTSLFNSSRILWRHHLIDYASLWILKILYRQLERWSTKHNAGMSTAI